MRLLLALAFLAAGSLASFARTEEGLMWTQKSSEGLTTLSYGSLDPAKTPLFLLSCFNGVDVAVLDIFAVIEGTRPGQALTIELSAGSAQSPLKGEASVDDATGSMFAEAGDIALKPVLEVLREKGPLTIKMGLTTTTLSDAGRADAVDKFSKDCELD
jgi:hypothetical protein